jgi:hypothetical protein
MATINANICIRRDTATNWTNNNPTLLVGEMCHETDTGKFKVGTGAVWTSTSYANTQTTSLTVTNDATINGVRVGKGNNSNTTNTAVGTDALVSLTTPVGGVGSLNNTAVGHQAGSSLIGASNNTLIGRNAGSQITGGAGNTAGGFDNTCVGSGAGGSIVLGHTNTIIGSAAGSALASDANTLVGYAAASSTTTGTGNTAIGSGALQRNTTGSNNVAVGNDALRGVAGATIVGASTAVGASALLSVQPGSTSHSNTAVGFQAGMAITTGKYNVAFGNQALVQNKLGDNNTALGEYSGDGCKASDNVAVGRSTGYRNWWGNSNVMIGSGAGLGNGTIDSQSDEFFATNAPYSASENTIIGFEAFKFPKDTTGQASFSVTIAAGSPIVVTWAVLTPVNGTKVAFKSTGTLPGALSSGVTYYVVGQSSTTFRLALTPGGAQINNATAGSGTVSGYLSGVTVANGNTVVGYQAGANNPFSGTYNCLIGWRAGDQITVGSGNIVIGADQEVDSVSGSDQINIGAKYFHNRWITTPLSLTALNNLPGLTEGMRGFCTDATATTFASTITGGGSNNVPCYYDGAWKIG